MLGFLGFTLIWGLTELRGWSLARRREVMTIWCMLLVIASLPGVFPPLANIVGMTFGFWFMLWPLAVAVEFYRRWLAELRKHANPGGEAAVPEAAAVAPLAEPAAPDVAEVEDIDRYSRHLLLREIGGQGQQRLAAGRVLVVGAGGLGAPVLSYLAAAGVGTITLVDGDVVEPSNLQRQVIFGLPDLGKPKAEAAAAALARLNPGVVVRPVVARLTAENAASLIAGQDLVLDGTDDFATRQLVNRSCTVLRVPLISGALAQWEGQLSTFDPARGGPCYHCLFPTAPAPGQLMTCAEAGVAAPLPGVIGSMMALEAVKDLTGAGEGLRGRLLIHDGLYGESRLIAIRPRPGCPVCGGGQPVLAG